MPKPIGFSCKVNFVPSPLMNVFVLAYVLRCLSDLLYLAKLDKYPRTKDHGT